MLTHINPKLPMRSKDATKEFYINKLKFNLFGSADFDGYLMLEKDEIQIHFFEFKDLNPKENYGQIYIRVKDIESWHHYCKELGIVYDPLQSKPWGQKEFALLDPDGNLLTFGESV